MTRDRDGCGGTEAEVEGVKGVRGVVRALAELVAAVAAAEVISNGSWFGGLGESSVRSRGRLERKETDSLLLWNTEEDDWSGYDVPVSAMTNEKMGKSRSGKLAGHQLRDFGDDSDQNFGMPTGLAA